MAEPLLGRAPEVAEGDRFLDRVSVGRASVMVITGEPGIGKTALSRIYAQVAGARGYRTASAWCWAAEEAPAFWPWRQAAAELGWTEPAWTDVASTFESVASELRRSAEPTLILFDDAHGADESSLELINLCARGLTSLPLALVLTICEEDIAQGTDRSRLFDQISRGGTRLDLFGLSREGVVELLHRSVGNEIPSLVQEAVVSASDGNPYLVEQLAREVSGGRDLQRPDLSLGFTVPRGADAILDRIVRRLPDEANHMLSMASVLGRTFSSEILASLARQTPDEVARILRDAELKGVLRRLDSLGTYGFTHALLREMFYEDLQETTRRSLHLAAAQALERLGDPSRLGELAHHRFKAGTDQDVQQAIDLLVRAARSASTEDESARHTYRAQRLAAAAGIDLTTETEVARPHRDEDTGRPQPAATFRPEGEFWSVGLGDTTVLLKESKGLGYISRLLAAPQQEVHCLDLASPAARTAISSSDMGSVLDPQAKREYRKRLDDLEEEIDEATTFNDDGRLRKAEEEKEFLLQELAAATGLGGRDRVSGAASERARVAVTRAIRSALRRIAAAHPGLGDHLDRSIHTGTFLAYKPDPMATPIWQL